MDTVYPQQELQQAHLDQLPETALFIRPVAEYIEVAVPGVFGGEQSFGVVTEGFVNRHVGRLEETIVVQQL
jgi:hypothetical protein